MSKILLNHISLDFVQRQPKRIKDILIGKILDIAIIPCIAVILRLWRLHGNNRSLSSGLYSGLCTHAKSDFTGVILYHTDSV